jgi:hypothetical protein
MAVGCRQLLHSHRPAKADALQAAATIGQTRLQMTLSLVNPISYPLLTIVVAWATFLFCGYGLLSKRHPMSYVILGFGALAIASAIYCIADLSSPYSGLFTVSPEPIADVLDAVDDAAKPGGFIDSSMYDGRSAINPGQNGSEYLRSTLEDRREVRDR